MKYTFIAEDYSEEEFFRTCQESEMVTLEQVIEGFETFLHGAGFYYEGNLDIVNDKYTEPTDLWSWSTTEPVPTAFDDVEKFLLAVGQECPPDAVPETDQAKLYKKLIEEEYEEFQEAYEANDDVEILDACFDMIWVIIGYMKSRGWDCEAAWDEGAQSNLSKIDPETGFVIRRPEDGKILKPEGWQPPDFSQFV